MNFDWDKDYTLEELLQSVIAIKEFPNKLAKILNALQPEDFEKQYREGSWTITQLIHHLADAHMNAYVRTQHIIHQDTREFQLWDHELWGSGMGSSFHHEASFMILLGLHQKWSLLLLECLKKPEEYLAKSCFHPLPNKMVSLAQLIALYAWHGEHHLNQIILALNSNSQNTNTTELGKDSQGG
jgi:hypothetical protein